MANLNMFPFNMGLAARKIVAVVKEVVTCAFSFLMSESIESDCLLHKQRTVLTVHC